MWYNRCKETSARPRKSLHVQEDTMYRRKRNQVTIYEDPAMFGGLALNPDNEWVKLAKLIPWWAFEERYAALFSEKMGQPA